MVINTTKNKSKLQIIENEFKIGEKIELKLQQEEEDVRNAVRKKKLNELERKRRANRVLMMKEDRQLKHNLSVATKEVLGIINRKE